MGNAGLALPFDVVDNNRLNPGMLGYGPKRFGVAWPMVAYDLGGLTTGDISRYFSDFSNGAITSNDAKLVQFGEQFGQQERDLSLDVGLGFYYDGFALNGLGQASASTKPNAALQTYETTGSYTEGSNLQLDAYGLGYYEVGAGYGHKISISNGTLSVGGSLDYYRAYYDHGIVSYSQTESGLSGTATNGADVGGANGGVVSKTALGLDLGALGQVGKDQNTYYGFVIKNAIKPNIKFNEQLPNSETIVPGGVNPFGTSFNLGVGEKFDKNVLVALDYDDIGNKTGFSQLGGGVEYPFGSFAVRGGYNTLTGFTIGFSAWGLNVALGSTREVLIGAQFRF